MLGLLVVLATWSATDKSDFTKKRRRAMPRLAHLVLSLSLYLTGSQLFAQSAIIELYGEGVHRFFGGDLFGAEEHLTRVIDSGVGDPRAYYFRGLVQECRGGAGDYDFETGARLEAEGTRAFDIGFALSRIQGPARVKIEKYRLDARVRAQQQALMMDAGRIDRGNVPPAPRPELRVPPVDATDPFGAGAGVPLDAPAVEPTVEPTVEPEFTPVPPVVPEVDSTDPFADDPLPIVPPATLDEEPIDADPPALEGDDPFGFPPAADAADVFGGSEDVPLDDPFGT
jgi:hypothetical protein